MSLMTDDIAWSARKSSAAERKLLPERGVPFRAGLQSQVNREKMDLPPHSSFEKFNLRVCRFPGVKSQRSSFCYQVLQRYHRLRIGMPYSRKTNDITGGMTNFRHTHGIADKAND